MGLVMADFVSSHQFMIPNCTAVFLYVKKLEILTLMSQYILSLSMFVVQNKKYFLTNDESHNIDIDKGMTGTFLKQI
jgi:hypothetical protein